MGWYIRYDFERDQEYAIGWQEFTIAYSQFFHIHKMNIFFFQKMNLFKIFEN
jgi:hypothetical protein